VPSRKHKGKFMPCPSAAAVTQMLMVSGLDKYFRSLPAIRDKGRPGHRSPGVFYRWTSSWPSPAEDVFAVRKPCCRTFTKFR
jgi:hypothetical protein